MIKKTVLLVFFFFCLTKAFSQQSPNDYTYVVVPEQFTFLHGADQHQLNSLTKFLLNKYGFNAYFSSELPNVKRCDGLHAEVISNSNFIYTRLSVVLRDCYGTEIFRSEEGKSKYKDYRQAYHQSLRMAFESVEALGIHQKKPIDYDNEPAMNKNETDVGEVNPQQMAPANNDTEFSVSTGAMSTESGNLNLPTGKYSSYTSGGASFLLRKTESGYVLYEETKEASDGLKLIGSILSAGNSIQYISEGGVSHTIVFKENKDFVITDDGGSKVFKKVN